MKMTKERFKFSLLHPPFEMMNRNYLLRKVAISLNKNVR